MKSKKMNNRIEKLTKKYKSKADKLNEFYVSEGDLEQFFTHIYKYFGVDKMMSEGVDRYDILSASLIEHFIDWAEKRRIKFWNLMGTPIASLIDKSFKGIKIYKNFNYEKQSMTKCKNLFEVLSWNDFEEPVCRFYEIYKYAFGCQIQKNNSGSKKSSSTLELIF